MERWRTAVWPVWLSMTKHVSYTRPNEASVSASPVSEEVRIRHHKIPLGTGMKNIENISRIKTYQDAAGTKPWQSCIDLYKYHIVYHHVAFVHVYLYFYACMHTYVHTYIHIYIYILLCWYTIYSLITCICVCACVLLFVCIQCLPVCVRDSARQLPCSSCLVWRRNCSCLSKSVPWSQTASGSCREADPCSRWLWRRWVWGWGASGCSSCCSGKGASPSCSCGACAYASTATCAFSGFRVAAKGGTSLETRPCWNAEMPWNAIMLPSCCHHCYIMLIFPLVF